MLHFILYLKLKRLENCVKIRDSSVISIVQSYFEMHEHFTKNLFKSFGSQWVSAEFDFI